MTPEQLVNIYEEPPEKAEALLQPLAEKGNAVAQFYLGHLCDEKSPRDQVAAFKWYRKSSENGHQEATHFLASFMYFGLGTPQDIEGALRLFRQLAEHGLDISQWKLGQHLVGSPQTREEGILWLSRAAKQGHASAQEQLFELESGKHA